MSSEIDKVIADARATKVHLCPQCRYSLEGVPTDDQQRISCPECGYAMRFVVSVNLAADDPEYDRQVRIGLGRSEKVLTRIALAILMFAIFGTLVLFVFM